MALKLSIISCRVEERVGSGFLCKGSSTRGLFCSTGDFFIRGDIPTIEDVGRRAFTGGAASLLTVRPEPFWTVRAFMGEAAFSVGTIFL